MAEKKCARTKRVNIVTEAEVKAPVAAECNDPCVEPKKKILFVASEARPFIATGGLADVLGSLPKALAENKARAFLTL